jgi:hypothetical protein
MDTLRLTSQGNITPLYEHDRWIDRVQRNGERIGQFVLIKLNEDAEGNYIGTLRIDVDIQNGYANIGISSIPALLFGTSSQVPTQSDMARLDQSIYDYVEPYIDYDPRNFMVSRLDDGRILETAHPPEQYVNDIASTLPMKVRQRQVTKYPNYIRVSSNHFAWSLYDKFARLEQVEGHKDKGKKCTENTLQLSENTNLLRNEIQYRNSNQIANNFTKGLTTKHLTEDWFHEKMHQNRIKYFNQIYKATKCMIPQTTIADFIRKHGTSALLDYLALTEGLISVEGILAGMKAAGMTQQAINKRRKYYAELLAMHPSRMGLIDELRTLIYAA